MDVTEPKALRLPLAPLLPLAGWAFVLVGVLVVTKDGTVHGWPVAVGCLLMMAGAFAQGFGLGTVEASRRPPG